MKTRIGIMQIESEINQGINLIVFVELDSLKVFVV